MKKLIAVLTFLSIGFVFAGNVFSAPITLFTDEISKLKFVNYESLTDNNGNGVIDTGDRFEGILNMESITNISGSRDLSAQLLNKEVTGHFSLSVVGGAIPIGGTGHIDFAFNPGDFYRLYVGEGATKNWDPAAADAIGRATDGALWAEVLPGTFYEGINDTTTVGGSLFSLNLNWADITNNLTGYPIQPLLYPEVIPAGAAHTYLGANHPNGHLVDAFFSSHLTTPSGIDQWDFRSEDPLYLHAVPEPSTFLLLGAGILGVGLMARRRSH